MTDSVRELLFWILPPVLGAIIGYVTNAVAIKMLFRPYREVRILGVRLPFTPGIIPRQRYKLADNIGRMVSDELLTEDTLIKQLKSEKFRNGLEQAVSRLTDSLLESDFKRIGSVKNGENSLLPMAEGLIRGFLKSKGIKRIIYLVIRSALHSLTRKKIGELFRTEEQRTAFLEWIYGLLRSPDTGNRIVDRASTWLQQESVKDAYVGDYMPAEVGDWIVGMADVLYEPFFEFVVEWLQSEGMKNQLEVRGRYLLRDILDKLSVFQRFLVAATQYDRTLDEKMPEIIADVIASMKDTIADDTTRARMLETIAGSVDKLRQRKISDASDSYDISGRVGRALESIQKAIAKDTTGESLKAVLANLLRLVEGKTVESFLERTFTVDDAAEYLTEMATKGVEEEADRISGAAVDFLTGLVDGGGSMPIGELIGLSEDAKRQLDEKLAAMAGRALESRVPGILASLDLNDMVVAKINGLDVENVEGLLLRVIHRHLKWINVFGAILGFLIGMIQVVMRLF